MYDELYAAWKREISNSSLGSLPSDFYAKITVYLGKIREDNKLLDNKSLKVALLEHEKQHVNRMLNEFLELRYEKLMRAITEAQKIPANSLAAEEAKICENFLSFSSDYQKFTKSLLQGETFTPSPTPVSSPLVSPTASPATPIPVVLTPHKRVTLRFSKNVPAVIGFDMKTYGPFLVEDVASLPVENAKILVKQGLAVQVELPGQ
jgi:DNA replication initiation complex subunit (GINS family)